eukprot:227213_1
MNAGSYAWKITDEQLIKSICDANFKETFSSDIFEIAKLKWQTIVYPNGFSDKSRGSFMVCIKLLEIPKTWKKIITSRTSKCVQTSTSNTSIEHFRTSGQVKGGSRYTLSLSELKATNPSEITIITSVNILRIILKNNQLLYQNPIRNFQSKPKFTWKIDQSMIKQGQFTKALESPVHHEMWIMRCIGTKVKGFITMQLMLVALPANISKLKISYTVKCIEVNVSKSATITLYFSENDAGEYSTGFTKFIAYQQVKNVDTLTFEGDINILNGYDEKDNEISMTEIEWNAYANQHKISQEHKEDNISTDEYKEIKNEISCIKQQLNDQNGSLSTNIEQNNKLMEQIQNNLNEITKEINDLKLISEEKKNDNFDNIKKEMEIMKRNIDTLMNEKALNDSKQNKKQAAMKKWLNNVVGLPQYIDLFIENGIEDMDTISHITMNELQMCGIDKIGHKIKITKAIQRLNEQSQEPKSV